MDRIRDFYLVWAEGGGTPTHKHATEQDARAEAERLARAHPNAVFCVLGLIGAAKKSDVQWMSPIDENDELPF
jgi:hypothetical protein